MQDLEPRTINKVPYTVVTPDVIEKQNRDGQRIRVQVIHPKGVYYEYQLRREGDVFDLVPKEITVCDKNTGQPVMENGKPKKMIVSAQDQFSSTTMRIVDMDSPEKITTAQGAINKVQNELDSAKAPNRSR